MKKLKIILFFAAAVILLLLNISIISSNGKVEEMYVSVNPELASAEEQCKLFEYFAVCHCRYGEVYCLLAHCPSGYLCDADIVVEE